MEDHCATCLAFFHASRLVSMYASAHSRKVTARASSKAVAASCPARCSIGSVPANTSFRASTALSRASAKDTTAAGPSPMSRRRPAIWKRKIHVLAPLLVTWRYRPLPSANIPGVLMVSTFRAESPAARFGMSHPALVMGR